MSKHTTTTAYSVAFVYGAIVLVGGVFGYIMAGSHISLWSGLLFGLGLFGSSILMVMGRQQGHVLAVSLTAILTVFFNIRYLLTKAFMPAGMMALVSAFALVALVVFRPKK